VKGMKYAVFFFKKPRVPIIVATTLYDMVDARYYMERIPHSITGRTEGCTNGIICKVEDKDKIKKGIESLRDTDNKKYEFKVMDVDENSENFKPFVERWDRLKW